MSGQDKEKLALEEVKQLYNQNYKIGDILDNKATNLLSSSSLILTLFSVLQIALIDNQSPAYIRGLIVVFFLYLALVIDILWIVWPKTYYGAFEANWEGVKKAILDSEIPIRQLISNYLDRIEKNKRVNKRKNIGLKISTVLFMAIMLLLIYLSLFTSR